MTSLSPAAAPPSAPAHAGGQAGVGAFFRARRGDSPFKRVVIHLTLMLCCVATIYPLLRVLSVSLRPGDRLRVETPGGGGYGRATRNSQPATHNSDSPETERT